MKNSRLAAYQYQLNVLKTRQTAICNQLIYSIKHGRDIPICAALIDKLVDIAVERGVIHERMRNLLNKGDKK